MGQGYCSFCEKQVEGIGKGGRNCPTCKMLIGKKEPEKKETTSQFAQGFSGTLTPEELLRFERLQKAGLVKDANDIMRRGLLDLEGKYLNEPKHEETQTSPKGYKDIMQDMMESMQMQVGMKQMGQQLKGDGMGMNEMMQMMMMQNAMQMMRKDQGGDNDGRLAALESEIKRKDDMLFQQQQQQQFAQILTEVRSKGNTDSTSLERLEQMRLAYEQRIDRARTDVDNVKSERNADMILQLQQKIDKKSEEEGWSTDMRKMFFTEAMNNVKEQFKKGVNATKEKGSGEMVSDIIGGTMKHLEPVLTAWAHNKQNQQAPLPIHTTPPNANQTPQQPIQEAPAATQQPTKPTPPDNTELTLPGSTERLKKKK